MTHLIIKKKNEVFVTIDSEQYVYHELSDHFTFEVPGAKFMPQYRNKYWDGKIRLYDMRKNEIYTGLVDRVISFCNRKGYTYEFEGSKFEVRNTRIIPDSPEVGDKITLEVELVNSGIPGIADLEIKSVTNNQPPIFEGKKT